MHVCSADDSKHAGNNQTNHEASGKEHLDAWATHWTETGTKYYYNALTGESTYEKPNGFKGEVLLLLPYL